MSAPTIARLIESSQAELAADWTSRHLRIDAIRSEAVREFSLGELRSGYSQRYLPPLLKLIAAFARTGNEDYAEVYGVERMRFAESSVAAAAWLEEVIACDEADLLALTAGDAELTRSMSEMLRRLHRPLLEDVGERELHMTLVGDCLMTEIRASAVAQANRAGIALNADHFYFSARQGVGLASEDIRRHLSEASPDLVALSFLTFEGIPPYQALLAQADHLSGAPLRERAEAIVGLVGSFLDEIREVTAAPFLVHGACGLPLSRYRKRVRVLPALSRGRRRTIALLNDGIRELIENTENAIFFDEARVCGTQGLRRLGGPRFPRALTDGAMFHTTRLGAELAQRYVHVADAYLNLHRAKVLLVDFDNTLWDGVMAEGEVAQHGERQSLLKRLKQAGILLVSVSKNSPESIRWAEMELEEDDFVLHKVGWNQKAQSIQEAAQQLDLAPNSFVLLDDSPTERELVRLALPEVISLDPADPRTWQGLEWMLEFPNTRATLEAERRTEMYRQAVARRRTVSVAGDYDALMSSLQLRATFAKAGREDAHRVCELLARTNQFNTTTRRHARPELMSMLDNNRYGIYVSSLADKFGSLGVVGVVIVERAAPDVIFDSLVMSCRAMGFGLEYLLLAATLERESPWQRAIGRYVPTARNNPCADLFASAGFTREGDGEWVLRADASLPAAPAWLSVVEH